MESGKQGKSVEYMDRLIVYRGVVRIVLLGYLTGGEFMANCYFEFLINNEGYFLKLREFFYKIKEEKEMDILDSGDSKWLDYFEEEVLQRFWWPTEEELQQYLAIYEQTSIDRRLTEPSLQHPWDFESMVDAFACGEYELISCEKISDNMARIEYYPDSWPYGGSDSFKALIEYNGFNITAQSV